MHRNHYDTTYSPFRSFTREEWKEFDGCPYLPVSDIDLESLQSLNEPLNLEEVEDIYIPLCRLLHMHAGYYRKLHKARDLFFNNETRRVPFIIGVAGSVAVGKSTTSRVLQKLLSMGEKPLKVDLVTTDGFLYPNDELEKRGILNRKGFPESYDAKRLLSFLAAIKSGKEQVTAPVYSHLSYDVIQDEKQVINIPDILIVEGINVLQVNSDKGKKRRKIFVSDFFDFSIFVDAADKDIKTWYMERFLSLKDTAFQNPKSYFHKFANLSHEESVEVSNYIWETINRPNLIENILPTRFRADLILKKSAQHFVRGVRIRKI